MNLLHRRIEHREQLSVGRDPQQKSRRVGTRQQISGFVHRQRYDVGLVGVGQNGALPGYVDLINHSLVTGPGVQRRRRSVECKRPDVLVGGVVEHRLLAVGSYLVDLAFGRSPGVEIALRISRQRHYVELGGVIQQASRAVGGNLEDSTLMPRAEINVSGGVGSA